MAQNRTDHLRKLAERYIKTRPTDSEGVTIQEIAEWMVRGKHYEPERKQIIKLCKDELSSALTTATHLDPQGRKVRTFYCVQIKTDNGDKPKQGWLWKDVEKANYEFMLSAFQARRRGIAGDVTSLKTDLQSWNENHLPKGKRPIKISFDFGQEDEQNAAG